MIVGLILQDLIGIFGSFKFTPAIAYAFLGFLVAELIKLNDLLKRDTDDQQEYIPNEHDPNDGKKEMDLTNEYENVFTPFVKERIQRAGVRLGAMLNAIFKD